MKTIFLLLATVITTGLFAQNRDIFGKFTQSDGAQIKGSSTMIGYEKQLIITNYTGGSDNTATIEIEVPMSAVVGQFRNIMNAAAAANPSAVTNKITAINKPVAAPATALKQDIGVKPVNELKQLPIQPQQPGLARAEITVGTIRADQKSIRITNKIILEDIKIESCTDDVTTGKSKIKLKGVRIGWIYYSYDATGREAFAPAKSGWNTITGSAWNNF